jgi:DNA-binding Lrp family transcriptional regulator
MSVPLAPPLMLPSLPKPKSWWFRAVLGGDEDDPHNPDDNDNWPWAARRMWKILQRMSRKLKSTRFTVTDWMLAEMCGWGLRWVQKALKLLQDMGVITRYYVYGRIGEAGRVVEIVINLAAKAEPKRAAKAEPASRQPAATSPVASTPLAEPDPQDDEPASPETIANVRAIIDATKADAARRRREEDEAKLRQAKEAARLRGEAPGPDQAATTEQEPISAAARGAGVAAAVVAEIAKASLTPEGVERPAPRPSHIPESVWLEMEERNRRAQQAPDPTPRE